jgi:RNA polymerase sigma factor (TIGR02999 family)
MTQAQNFTAMLSDARAGKRESLDALLPLVYDELKKIAAHKLAAERSNHTLQATALVHEAYLRLIDQHSVNWQNRAHFFAIASEMMRRILVNYAESHNAKKRNEGKTLIALDDVEQAAEQAEVDLIFLDNALKELAEFDSNAARIVELKFFGGLTNEEAAEVLGVSESTVKREWRTARAWLTTKLT